MEQNKDQSNATVSSEAVALTDVLARFEKWKAYPLPELNSDGHFDKDWLHREFVAFKAGIASRAADALDSQPTRPCQADSPSLEFRKLLEQCRMALADAVWRSTPPIAVLRNLYEQIDKALASSQPTDFEDRPLKARVLRNELAIIIGCKDGRTGAEKADAVLNWIEKQGQHVFVSASSQPTDGGVRNG